jgi:hypothetical protein
MTGQANAACPVFALEQIFPCYVSSGSALFGIRLWKMCCSDRLQLDPRHAGWGVGVGAVDVAGLRRGGKGEDWKEQQWPGAHVDCGLPKQCNAGG